MNFVIIFTKLKYIRENVIQYRRISPRFLLNIVEYMLHLLYRFHSIVVIFKANDLLRKRVTKFFNLNYLTRANHDSKS